MLAAKFIPFGSEITVEQALDDAKVNGMVLCRPASFTPDAPFRCCAFPPERIPSGWRPVRVIVKTAIRADIEEATPCVA